MRLCRSLNVVLTGTILLGHTLYADSVNVDPKLLMALKQAAREITDSSNQMDEVIWLATMSRRLKRRIPDPFYRIALLKTVHTEAVRAGLDPELVLALIEIESQFDRFAVSRSGARGLMQVMPFWMKEIGHPLDNLFHPRTNLRYGCTILRYYLDMTGGDVKRALAEYNGSSEKIVYATKVMVAFDETWQSPSMRPVSE